ncbi:MULTISPECIES: helix-turn-helix domain-containing protein [Paenibacillus]|uniref:Helix-turn-helix domain-containing protein n=1 Tax=Paenibacillus radicis (ex Xue et al. 2023) TaxID=2972489 RepID=A0ABT1YGQ1_9BACL|nr:helix-turn-helix transcriptional regulator [Paenibacillus radicis (ex Xue et al. 2023)]MCR8631140.1 helix-turn-helix domain-containing protein [Paenibacillus radicis (ex Xue et al. 2023)]
MKITTKSNAFVKARIVKGLSQRDLAKRSGLSPSYISLLERSVKSVGPATAKRLSELLDQPLEVLFDIE